MRTSARRALRMAVSVAILAALVAFARTVDWSAVAAAARGADPLLLAGAVTLNLLSLLLKGVRWWLFLRPMGARSFALAIRATFAGAALNNILVAQGGEGARVLLVARGAQISSAKVLAALAIERVLDAVTYLILLVAAAWLLPLPRSIARWSGAASIALVVVLAALGALAWRSGRRTVRPNVADRARPLGAGRVAPSPLAPAPRSLLVRIRGYASRFASSAAEVAGPGRLATALLLSIAAWVLQIATYDFVARAALLPLPIAGSVAALIAIGVSFLVRATPGNVGIFQLVYVVTVHSFGVSPAPAVAVALLIQAVQVIPTLLAGAVAAPRLLLLRREQPQAVGAKR